MSIGKKHIIRHYTIVEVMVAMGIFLIMMTIMMQFFTSAQKVWNLASKKNMLYADARVAMNLMTRELQSMLYNNDDDGSTGIYPFWHEWQDITDCIEDYDNTLDSGRTTEAVPAEMKEYYFDNKDLFKQTGGTNSGELFVTALNFIATTDIKAVDEGSDICEIRYKFIPVYCKTSNPTSANDVLGGKLQRSCMEEYASAGVANTNHDYASFAYEDFSTPANRVGNVWENTGFETVITGVYSLRFTCYTWNSGLQTLQPMSSGGKDPSGGTISGVNLVTGTPKPVAVRIDMKLMDPKDLKKLIFAIYEHKKNPSNETLKKKVDNLKQTMRTFSKVIYLGKAEN